MPLENHFIIMHLYFQILFPQFEVTILNCYLWLFIDFALDLDLIFLCFHSM